MAEMGKDGFISFATSSSGGSTGSTTPPTYIDTWNLNPVVTLDEVTAFGNLSKAFLPAIRGWTATASGTLDKDPTQQQSILLNLAETTAATMLALYLRLQTSTGYYSGRALLSGVSINSKVGTRVGVTYNLQGTSSLAFV